MQSAFVSVKEIIQRQVIVSSILLQCTHSTKDHPIANSSFSARNVSPGEYVHELTGLVVAGRQHLPPERRELVERNEGGGVGLVAAGAAARRGVEHDALQVGDVATALEWKGILNNL